LMAGGPVRIAPQFVERVWGSHDLSPLFPPQAKKIGEVWFNGPPGTPLLIKFIFTTERLSIQVHPGDEYARRHHHSNGKTEMWHILGVEPGARVGLGLRESISKEQLRQACLDGSIVDLVDWKPVQPGDTLYAEAGAIHAIGAGVRLCEIQQNSDVTYRLYDYGRPRELHLDHGIEVAIPGPFDGRCKLPVHSRYFVTEELRWSGQAEYSGADLPEHYLIVLEGEGRFAAEPVSAGQVWLVPEGAAPVPIDATARLLRTYRPR
jgi:mannose-6-phosphate isomerase